MWGGEVCFNPCDVVFDRLLEDMKILLANGQSPIFVSQRVSHRCAHSGCDGVIADKKEVLKDFVEKDKNGLLFLVVARIDLFLGRVLLPSSFGLTRLNTMPHTWADAGYEGMCKFLVEQVPYRLETES